MTNAFIDREAFARLLSEIPRADGGQYEDIDTIWRDVSRLVVALLAATPPDKLQQMYAGLGWHGRANVRAMHEAAKVWMTRFGKDRGQREGASDAEGQNPQLRQHQVAKDEE